MKNFGIVLLVTCFFLALSSPVLAGAKKRNRFDSDLTEALKLCGEIAFPNSQARVEGFDIDAHVKELNVKRAQLSKSFHSDKGIKFLKEKLASEKDDVNKGCLNALIEENTNK